MGTKAKLRKAKEPGHYDDWCRSVMKRTKDIMEQRGITITALAEAIGTPRPHLSNALNGVVLPSFAYVARIADGLGVTVGELSAI